jgi:hypothetical protein
MSVTELIAIIAVVGYALYRQTRTVVVSGPGRFKLAIIYAAIGVLCGVHMPSDAAALAFLLVGLVVSAADGLLRGRLTRVWRDFDGRVYSRGTPVTIGLVLGLVLIKFALGTIAYFVHVPYDFGAGEVLITIALMVAVQSEVIWRRGRALADAEPATAPATAPGTAPRAEAPARFAPTLPR